ncbi:MAG: peptidylprolyl isomerase [Planctomycetes bacterium]|nr:peptidylprolyl isomerase [Planctomycetota bacterium]
MVRKSVKPKKKRNDGVAASKDKSRDVLARTGLSGGAAFIDGASKFLASYGKFITPVVTLVIIAFGAYYFWNKATTESEQDLRNEIEKAAKVDKLDELPGKMEEVISKADDEEMLRAFARYRYAIRAYELLERPYKADQLTQVVKIMDDYLGEFKDSEEHPAWNTRITELRDGLKADAEFLDNKENQARLPWTHHSKPDKPEPKLVDDPEPIVVFVTSVGKLRIKLYGNDAGNAVAHFVSLCDEGFFDRTDFNSTAFSNSFNATGPFRNATIITAGAKGRPIGVELEKPTTAKDGDDVDLVTVENPYTIDYQGSTTNAFEAGSIALNRDDSDPMRARSEFFVVLEPSDSLVQNFAPLGKILDGEDGMRIARRLGGATIYYTYIEQKPKDVKKYTPLVYYDGWPVATLKRDKAPDPVRFSKLETEVTPNKAVKDGGLNPLVVIELEKGDIVIELFEDVCPNTVANFINLIQEHFYNTECEFYRVEGTATDLAEIYQAGGARIIQGGFDQSQSRDRFDYGIKNEAVDSDLYKNFFHVDEGGLANARGTIAMARTSDLNSASTEFFINLKDAPNWDAKNSPYCVFGEVKDGLDLAAQVKKDDKILSAKVIRRRDHDYVPEVKYKEGGGYVKKKAVDDLPEKSEEEDKDKEDKS